MTEEDARFQQHMVNWFYHFTNSIETRAQENDSFAKLHFYLEEIEKAGKVSAALLDFTRTFIKDSFAPVLPLLCFRGYTDIYCGDVNENCFVESDNSSLKRDSAGPTANAKLAMSAHAIKTHTDKRMSNLLVSAAKKYGREENAKANGDPFDECRRDLSKMIVEYKYDQIVDQFEMSQGKPSTVYHVKILISRFLTFL